MASLNKAMLIGNITREVDTKYTASGTAISSVSIATNEKFKDKSGEWVDRAEFHNVTFFGKLAEIVQTYCVKGMCIYVEGRIATDKYTDKNGVEKYSTKIIADKMQMLGGKGKGDGGSKGQSQGQSQRDEYPTFDPDEDVPF